MIKFNRVAYFVLICLSFNNFVFAQKYQSLLWEISGNGLKKKSYLYGTMHVSGRIAYHLGEEFYTALNGVDAMALESNPIIWLAEINNSRDADQFLGEYYISNRIGGDFYTNAFQVFVPENADLGNAISTDNFLMNWLLYRENKRMADFEEDTFLDMFIYQAGSKNNKPVFSLEDFLETNRITTLANLPDEEENAPSDWYVKLTKDKSYRELLQDAYRNQNLDFLDSLQAETAGENYLKYMLYERNKIMARNIDSLLKTGVSLFNGVGAAHLPGDQGMIELLRAKGYTVSPIRPTITEKAKAEKEKLSKLKRPLPYNEVFSTELFQVKLPAPMYETSADVNVRDFFAPELTNGAFYSISLVSTYGWFSGNSKTNYAAKVDSLLFEYIPGKIITKKNIEKNGFKGWDILNQTKAGDFQRFQLFFTPLHVMIFKMGGKHDWVQVDGDNFFKSIELKPIAQTWSKVQPKRGDFSIHVPQFYSLKANSKVTALYDHPEIEAYDWRDSSYYFMRRGVYQDMNYIEEDDFELHRIMDKFIETLKIDSLESKSITTFMNYPAAKAHAKTKEGKNLHLKCVIRGPYYYLLASVENNENPNTSFFDSFKFEDFEYLFATQNQYDSIMRFSVTSSYLTPDPLTQQIRLARNKLRDKKVTDELQKSYNKSQSESYYSENYEEVKVDVQVFSPYYSLTDLDKFWEDKIERYKKGDNLYPKSKSVLEQEGMKIMEVSFADSASSRTIHKKYILNMNRLYTLTANLDTLSEKSKFVEDFFNTFQPVNEDSAAVSVFDDKARMFFTNIQSADSMTRDAALNAVNRLITFDKKHVSEMIQVIKNYAFPSEYITSKTALIQELGKIDHPAVLPFLTDYYMQMTDTSSYQIAILEALANQKTKKATRLFVKLLEKDIPVVNESRAIENAFRPFYDSVPLASYLFPDLLNYTFINKAYEDEIYYLASLGITRGKLNPKSYRRFTNDMVKKSKILIKAERSSLQKDKNYSGINNNLRRFANLLFPYNKNKQVKALIQDMQRLNTRFRSELVPIMLRNNVKVTKEYLASLQSDIKNYYNLSFMVSNLKEKQRELLPEDAIDQERLSRSKLFYSSSYNAYDENKDSIVFISREYVKTRRQEGWVYFYKSKKEKEDKWTMAYIGIQPKKLTDFSTDMRQTKTRITIPRGAKIEELIREEIKSIELKDRPRATEDSYGDSDFDFW